MKTSKLENELRERGLIAQVGGGELSDVLSKKRSMYVGVDPTSDSLQVGNLVPIILMKHLSDAGYTPNLLVGGGTGMIGDPRESGERQLLDDKTLQKNLNSVRKQLSSLLMKKNLKVFNNADWLKKVSLIEFLRDIGKHFTVNQLIKRDIIKRRLETDEDSISYTEFSYSLLQGYDYLHLHKKHNVDLQIGGSDQWANIISGVDLIRRKTGHDAYALTAPMIIDKVSGKKFGKSEGNAVWIDSKKTSPFAFYQFWINVDDVNVGDYLKVFTFLPLKKIEAVMEKHTKAPHERLAQKTLAKEITTFVHGAEITKAIEKVTKIIYGTANIGKVSPEVKKLLVTEVPSQKLTKKMLSKGIDCVDAVLALELAKSKSEARRLLESNAIKVNGKPATLGKTITEKDLKGDLIMIRRGKGQNVGFLYR